MSRFVAQSRVLVRAQLLAHSQFHRLCSDVRNRSLSSKTMTSPQAPKIWTSYDPKQPPALTDDAHVRFVIISDTHGTEPADVPNGDVLLHSGDLTKLGDHNEVQAQMDWIVSLPHPIKVLIGGNHDFALDSTAPRDFYSVKGKALHTQLGYPASDPEAARNAMNDARRRDNGRLIYLENQGAEFTVDRPAVQHKQWKVWGSPWSPEFGGWAWNYKRGEEAKEVHASIPKDIDVLLTHSPPHLLGDLDKITDGSHVGCEELTRKARAGEIQPVVWACGHIHGERRGTTE